MRHALVTAGSKGLGRKVTDMLIERGYAVTVSYRNDSQAVEKLKSDWAEAEDRLLCIKADITKPADIKQLVQKAKEKFGRLDLLINNAGPYIFEPKKLMDYTPEEWHEMIEGNLSSMFYLLQETVPIMREQHYGRVVAYGFQGAGSAPAWPYRSAYAAAKSGLASLVKTAAVEEAENGITINMVCPGVVTSDYKEARIEDARPVKDTSIPVGRPSTGEDIARTILFLCEEDSDMITGTIMEVTGGVDVLHKRR